MRACSAHGPHGLSTSIDASVLDARPANGLRHFIDASEGGAPIAKRRDAAESLARPERAGWRALDRGAQRAQRA
jgi:hypothetical protein